MNTTSQDLAVLHLVGHPLSGGERDMARAALVADAALFAHRAECSACNGNALCAQAQQLAERATRLRGVALGSASGLAELNTIMGTAESIVRDIVQVVRAGHLDHDVQTAFQCWISEALLQQPTTQQIDRLCRAAGFAGPVDVDTMKQRVDALQATINGLRRELSECITQRAALYSAGQTLVERWAHGELAQAVQTLATLLPSRPVVHDEAAAEQ